MLVFGRRLFWAGTSRMKRWLFLAVGTVACMAILTVFHFSDLSFLIVFLVIIISAALWHGD